MPLVTLRRSPNLSFFVLPLIIWSSGFAGFAYLCWGACASIDPKYFSSFWGCIRTVLQILTFDSWTDVPREFDKIDDPVRGSGSGYVP